MLVGRPASLDKYSETFLSTCKQNITRSALLNPLPQTILSQTPVPLRAFSMMDTVRLTVTKSSPQHQDCVSAATTRLATPALSPSPLQSRPSQKCNSSTSSELPTPELDKGGDGSLRDEEWQFGLHFFERFSPPHALSREIKFYTQRALYLYLFPV